MAKDLLPDMLKELFRSIEQISQEGVSCSPFGVSIFLDGMRAVFLLKDLAPVAPKSVALSESQTPIKAATERKRLSAHGVMGKQSSAYSSVIIVRPLSGLPE